jgi:tRNA uridine 5-carbamoylmethylation protein Kti12
MVDHPLRDWSQYLTQTDYNYLIQYVENVKNDISNDRMIVLSGYPRTGKSTLKANICEYLGQELCGEYPVSGEFIYNENIKRLGLFCGIDEISRSRKNNRAIINFIKYKQSLIADTNQIERVNPQLLEYCRVITMEHMF